MVDQFNNSDDINYDKYFKYDFYNEAKVSIIFLFFSILTIFSFLLFFSILTIFFFFIIFFDFNYFYLIFKSLNLFNNKEDVKIQF